MYANPGTKWACHITIPCRNQLILKTSTSFNHSKTIKTKGEMLHTFIIVTQESDSNQTKARNRVLLRRT